MDIFSQLADAKLNIFGLNVTFNWWKVVGWSGNLIFGTRFLLQWIATERAGRVVVPRAFWVVSSVGSLCLLAYFVFYRQDSVGILSVAFPLPIYLRNLYLQMKHGDEPTPPAKA